MSSAIAAVQDFLRQAGTWTTVSLGLGTLVLLVTGGKPSSIVGMLGFGTVEYTSADQTVLFRRKPNTDSNASSASSASTSTSQTPDLSLRQLVESVVPPVRLSPLLFNGHLQTFYVASGRGADAHIHYRRRIFQSDHAVYPGQFATDWVVPAPTPALPRDRSLPPRTHDFAEEQWTAHLQDDHDDAGKPLLVVLHGLSGGSHEQYIRQCLVDLTTSSGGGGPGFAAVVVNSRGCCYSKITSGVLFNARATWDLRQFVIWARAQWPQRRLFAIGFSLGANILCNYLGEEGEACEIEAAVLVGNPWNLDVSNAMLCSTTVGKELYQRAMGAGMKRLFERHIEQISKNPNIDVSKVRSTRYLYEWDRHVQCASWGYPTESAYYRDASSVDAALGIKIPVLCLGAKDDPVCSDVAVPYTQFQATPYIVCCSTSIGGHLGWFEPGGGRWSNKVIHGFFTKVLNETSGARHPDVGVNGKAQPLDDATPKPVFHPTLRRLQIPQ